MERFTDSSCQRIEFKQVLLYDVSEENYHTDQDRRILYTAISRAMEETGGNFRTLSPFHTLASRTKNLLLSIELDVRFEKNPVLSL